MWTTSTIGGKMFLSILVIWILLNVSAGLINLPCCQEGSDGANGKIIECFKQKPRGDCPKHFYVAVTKKGMYCINPNSKWLHEKMKKEKLKCPLPQVH